jgi:hypothetical protein
MTLAPFSLHRFQSNLFSVRAAEPLPLRALLADRYNQ